jgi:hypothetical protein
LAAAFFLLLPPALDRLRDLLLTPSIENAISAMDEIIL